MREVLKKYSGVLFLYLVMTGMFLLVSMRFEYLNREEVKVIYAMKN